MPLDAASFRLTDSVIARTVKGKGVPFMENELRWHYASPVDPHLCPALAALDDVERVE